jgi:indole-3-glycerol phosphate synthase
MRLTPLTEVHDREDMEKALECGADVIGINNRDLDTFEVDTKTTFTLAPMIPEDCIVVSESGINDIEDIRALKGGGINAVLIGSALMKSKDLAQITREMVNAGAGH